MGIFQCYKINNNTKKPEKTRFSAIFLSGDPPKIDFFGFFEGLRRFYNSLSYKTIGIT